MRCLCRLGFGRMAWLALSLFLASLLTFPLNTDQSSPHCFVTLTIFYCQNGTRFIEVSQRARYVTEGQTSILNRKRAAFAISLVQDANRLILMWSPGDLENRIPCAVHVGSMIEIVHAANESCHLCAFLLRIIVQRLHDGSSLARISTDIC